MDTISITTTKKYLSAIRAWHLAQGWPAPLSDEDHKLINVLLRGLQNIQRGKQSQPPRPPVTIPMLAILRRALNPQNPFDACVWATATCTFWGMMRFGEVSVKSRGAFDSVLHLKRSDCFLGTDIDGKSFIRLDLPSAKTAVPGKTQSVYLPTQCSHCPLEALKDLFTVVPAADSDPLFSWREPSGIIRPLVKSAALDRINNVFLANGWGTTFGHSIRIGGASFFLAQKVNPEIIRLAGRWKSLVYEAYIRAFELTASRHMGNMIV
ncbi:hypothetical protein M422DRAFT_189758 [Sphaerobolus stellatus SS14]|uniref:DNA breaking-rejoining enzyme n=1 Tax=Sphaerobolus stellatus (strain SS14) TaxID=990650 RepID=A0A0C9UTD3_SPHS4|nr:hypothetical protein M422DRAFT_189758 [Sphaerobolus stellatus SS14]